jgi:hypothetical protein
VIPRLIPALLGFLAAALLVTGSLLPEFEVGGVGVAQIDPERVGWVPAMVGMLVQVGLVLSGALMLALGESRQVAGGILIGTGILGLTLRIVRVLQLGEAPGYDAAFGSWIDALAEGLTTLAGVLALIRGTEAPDEHELEEDLEPEAAAPLPGESQ